MNINTPIYKILYTDLKTSKSSWISAFKHAPVIGEDGKIFSSKVQVNIMFRKLQNHKDFGTKFVCEILTFNTIFINCSSSPLP